ncbi:MAG: AP2/ERF family transcription factor [Sulfuritalea sp.]|nr:AP2/ERF family transcription factor [Sulfuritalea sp.]
MRFSRCGKLYSKAFYDLACGGARAAKAQAIAWRDEQLAAIKALTLLEFHQQKRSNNISGVPGVHFHKTSAQSLGFWQAKIKCNDGKRLAKSFSVRKFGEREAFHLAVAARSELLAKVEDRPYLYHAVAKRLSR